MKHFLGLILVPENADVSEHITKMMTKETRNGLVKPYTMRFQNNDYEGELPLGFVNDTFVENNHKNYPLTRSPFIKIDRWTVGGRYSGCLKSEDSHTAPATTQEKLFSLEYNSVKTKDFGKAFCPQILILPSGEWLSSQGDLTLTDVSRNKSRIMLEIRSNPQTTAVILDLEVEQNTERYTLVAFNRG